jgi:hypothetical protein
VEGMLLFVRVRVDTDLGGDPDAMFYARPLAK